MAQGDRGASCQTEGARVEGILGVTVRSTVEDVLALTTTSRNAKQRRQGVLKREREGEQRVEPGKEDHERSADEEHEVEIVLDKDAGLKNGEEHSMSADK